MITLSSCLTHSMPGEARFRPDWALFGKKVGGPHVHFLTFMYKNLPSVQYYKLTTAGLQPENVRLSNIL